MYYLYLYTWTTISASNLKKNVQLGTYWTVSILGWWIYYTGTIIKNNFWFFKWYSCGLQVKCVSIYLIIILASVITSEALKKTLRACPMGYNLKYYIYMLYLFIITKQCTYYILYYNIQVLQQQCCSGLYI